MPIPTDFSGTQFLIGLATVSSLWVLALCGLDKRAAKRDSRRVSERSLLLPVLFGGGPGLLAGMLLFRHKTAKRTFQIKFAGALVLWGLSLLWMLRSA